MFLRKSFPLYTFLFVFSFATTPQAGELKTPADVPSMSGLPIDMTSVRDAVVQDNELIGLRIMAILSKEYPNKNVPCSNLNGTELMSDFRMRAKNDLQRSNKNFDELAVSEQNKILARLISQEWSLSADSKNKKERLVRNGRAPAQCK